MLDLSHKKLDVYSRSLIFIKEVYHVTSKFPVEEKYGLVTQIRRAAVSVCSNLAEGAARRTPAEQARFYEIARSSAVEVDSQFEIAMILSFILKDELSGINDHLSAVFAMLSKLINAVNPSQYLR